jgi:hypothetical protein
MATAGMASVTESSCPFAKNLYDSSKEFLGGGTTLSPSKIKACSQGVASSIEFKWNWLTLEEHRSGTG